MTASSSLRSFVLCAACVPLPALAAPPEVVFERVAPSVLVVERVDRAGRRNGFASGVVVGPSQVVTSCHALTRTATVRVRSSGRRHDAVLTHADPERDLCRLLVDGLQAPALPIASPSALKVGQRVYAVGTPKGLERTISEGIISSLRPRARSFVIQTTAPISSGSSGGGLFDEEGRLVGVTAFQFTRGQNLNFAVPASWVRQIEERAQARWARTGAAESGADPFGGRVLALLDIGNAEAALMVAREWILLAPTDALPRHALGRAFAALERADEADAAFRSALRIRPDLLPGWLDLGALLAEQGDPAQALDAYSRARELDANCAPAWIGTGLALSAMQRHPEAVEALRHAIDLDRGNAAAWEGLTAAHIAESRLDLAAAAARRALRLHPESAALWHQFGMVQAQRGDRAQAIQAQHESLRLQPGYVPALYELGALYHAQGERAKSREAYEKLRKLDRRRAAQFRARYLQ